MVRDVARAFEVVSIPKAILVNKEGVIAATGSPLGNEGEHKR